jgi:hypothetical protein
VDNHKEYRMTATQTQIDHYTALAAEAARAAIYGRHHCNLPDECPNHGTVTPVGLVRGDGMVVLRPAGPRNRHRVVA